MAAPDDDSLFRVELAGGARFSHVLKRHHVLRLVDVKGGGNVSALFYNFDVPLERYNMPDTLKAQYTAFLTRGRVIMSDMGRALCSIVEDTAGYHDTLAGHSDAASVAARYGTKTYQEARNGFYRNARDNFLLELAQWGLGRQDIVPTVNFFSKVVADEAGKLTFVPNPSPPGAHVDLRAEMNVLVVLSANAHPLDPGSIYDPRPIEVAVRRGAPPGPEDMCRCSRPEAGRALENAERFFQ